MTPDTIDTLLPDPQPVYTIGHTLTLQEEAARQTTLPTVIDTIFKEADHLREMEGPQAYSQAISQAWGYTQTMKSRRRTTTRWDPDTPGPTLRESCLAQERNMTIMALRFKDALAQAISEEPSDEEETDDIAHGAATALLAAHAALREHVQGIREQDDMSAGHAQAAVGLKITIDGLAETLESQHDDHCHHCDTIERAQESADDAEMLMDAMRPAIQDLTPVELHTSLLQEGADREAARNLAESTIDQFGSFQLLLDGDPPDPERSLHCFYLDGTLHVKRLTDPFPKGMTLWAASTIASKTGAGATYHALDRAAGFADPIADRALQMKLEADSGLQTATTEEIDQYLEAVVRITKDPATQADAVTALAGDRRLAERLMARRPDLFPPATPAQRERVMDAVRTANLRPEIQDLIDGILSKGPAALNQRADPPPVEEVIHLMQIAASLIRDEMTMMDIAASLGRPTHRDGSTSAWVDKFIDDRV